VTHITEQILNSQISIKKIQNGSKPPFQKPLIIIILNNKPHNVSTDISFYIYDRPLTGVHVVAGFCAYKV